MGKAAPTLTLQQKYELLRKKQSEKSISKKESDTSLQEGNKKLSEMIIKKQQEEAQQASKPRARKLPTNLQRVLKTNPMVLQQEAPPEEEKGNEGGYRSLSRRRGEEDQEFFIRREGYNPSDRPDRNRNENQHGSNRTYTDAEGIEYFTCTVFVGDISPNAAEYHLEEAFHHFGQIISARIINDKPYGFVKFKYEEDARRAIAEMNGHLLCGTPIRVSSAKVPTHKTQYRRPPYGSMEQSRGGLDNLPDRDGQQIEILREEEEYYGHLGTDDSIQERELVTYDDI